MRQALEDHNGVGYSLFNLSVHPSHEGNHERANLLVEDSLPVMERSSDPPGRGYALIFLGRVGR